MREGRSDAFARDRLQRLRRSVMKLGRKLEKLEPTRRHRLRIRAKKLRYAAEFFGECFKGRRRRERLLDSLEELQEGLGSLQDVTVAHDLACSRSRTCRPTPDSPPVS
jgi:triphosphatase